MKLETDLSDYIPLKINSYYKVNLNKGTVINARNIMIGHKASNNYYGICMNGKNTGMHRLIYSAKFGDIPKDKVVDHIDNNKLNNSINNLQLLSVKENVRKSMHNKDNKNICRLMNEKVVKVKAIDYETNNIHEVYESIYACSKDLNVNPGIIKYCCDKTNRVKSGTSKLTHHRFRFEYTSDQPTKLLPRTRNYSNGITKDKAYQEAHAQEVKKTMKTIVNCICGHKVTKGSMYLHKKSNIHAIGTIENKKI
jgi:hypothetical protein